MKMKPEHFAILKDAVALIDTKERRAAHARCNLPPELEYGMYKLKLMVAAKLPEDFWSDVYAYCNDKNVDVVMNKLVPRTL